MIKCACESNSNNFIDFARYNSTKYLLDTDAFYEYECTTLFLHRSDWHWTILYGCVYPTFIDHHQFAFPANCCGQSSRIESTHSSRRAHFSQPLLPHLHLPQTYHYQYQTAIEVHLDFVPWLAHLLQLRWSPVPKTDSVVPLRANLDIPRIKLIWNIKGRLLNWLTRSTIRFLNFKLYMEDPIGIILIKSRRKIFSPFLYHRKWFFEFSPNIYPYPPSLL